MGIRVKRANASVDDMRDQQNAAANLAKLQADLDYVAMMADVEMPDEMDEEVSEDEAV